MRNWQDDIKKISQLPIIGKSKLGEKEEKFLREICKYEFYNLEEPGVMLKFTYQTQGFTLMHGGQYELPRFIAKHLESCHTPIWDWRPDGVGGMHKRLTGKKPRFRLSQIMD